MFITLLGVTFAISLGVSLIVVSIFGKPIDSILQRIISDEISQAWVKYHRFDHLRAGRMYNLEGRRDEAITPYKVVLSRGNVFDSTEQGRHGLNQPYKNE